MARKKVTDSAAVEAVETVEPADTKNTAAKELKAEDTAAKSKTDKPTSEDEIKDVKATKKTQATKKTTTKKTAAKKTKNTAEKVEEDSKKASGAAEDKEKNQVVEPADEDTKSSDKELLSEISDDVDAAIKEEKPKATEKKPRRVAKKTTTAFDKENFDIDQIGEKEEAYILEKRRVWLSDDFGNQYKDDNYVPSLLLSDAPTQYDYYQRERQLYTQSAISQGNAQLILSGIIIGTDTTKNGIPYVIVKTDSVLTSQFKVQELDIKHLITVRIPASALFFEEKRIRLSKDNKEAGESKLRRELKERLFSRIFYVAENFQEELRICWCSRIGAMLAIQKRAFYPTDERPALLKVGNTTAARVIAVGHNKVTVEVDGVDCVLTRKNLSWLSLRPSLKDEFKVNEVFTVKILSVDIAKDTISFRSKNEKHLNVVVSKTAAEKDPANEYYNYYINNPTATGIITSELTADGVYVRLADMIDVLCDVSIDEPVVGAPCKVKLLHAEQREDKNHNGQMRWYLKGILKEVLPLKNNNIY